MDSVHPWPSPCGRRRCRRPNRLSCRFVEPLTFGSGGRRSIQLKLRARTSRGRNHNRGDAQRPRLRLTSQGLPERMDSVHPWPSPCGRRRCRRPNRLSCRFVEPLTFGSPGRRSIQLKLGRVLRGGAIITVAMRSVHGRTSLHGLRRNSRRPWCRLSRTRISRSIRRICRKTRSLRPRPSRVGWRPARLSFESQ